MQWTFPMNYGGRDSGFHDAGLETFKGNLERYLARELIQNSLDARLDDSKPVEIKFQLLDLPSAAVPDLRRLRETFRRCRDYWQGHPKAVEFFERAYGLAGAGKLSTLKVSDYNTTGVPGSDADRTGNWYSLVRCAGSSPKGGGEGGSYGIGKNAPFAASRLQTVVYSTMTHQGHHAFQGVATLASHELPDGGVAQPTGFLGGTSGESVRRPEEIPVVFRRSEPGLAIGILGYPENRNWQRDLLHSVLESFWPAISFGDLKVSVGDQTVDQQSVDSFMEDYSAHEDFTAHYYYRAFVSPESRVFRDSLATLRDVSLHLSAGDADLPKRVAMVRKTGMVIFLRGYWRSVVPFCGVFLCRNETGNRILREMEPPRHDTWDPDHPEKGANKRVEKEYLSFIRESIKQLAPADTARTIPVPDLNRFLPDDDESEEASFEAADRHSKKEAPDRALLPETIPGRPIEPRGERMQPDAMNPAGGDTAAGADEAGEEATEFDEGEREQRGEPSATDGPAPVETGAAVRAGNVGGKNARPPVPVRYRAFSVAGELGTYRLIVARGDDGDAPVHLIISTVGDDQKAAAQIRAARLDGGHPIPNPRPGVLGPLALPPQTSVRLEVVLSRPELLAMEVTAHEA